MGSIIQQVIEYLEYLAGTIPLPTFAFIGSIIDEVIAPLPSPFIPVTVGTLAYEQGHGFYFLLLIALTGTIGKTLSTIGTYWIADKFEDVITHSRLGKILGVDENEVEKYGRYLDGTRKDDVILLFLRSAPFVPTKLVSVLCGFIKINIWTYVWTTFIGTYIRFLFFILVAYEGLRKYSGLLSLIDTTGSLVTASIIMGFIGWLFFFLSKRWDRIFDFFFKKKPVEHKGVVVHPEKGVIEKEE